MNADDATPGGLATPAEFFRVWLPGFGHFVRAFQPKERGGFALTMTKEKARAGVFIGPTIETIGAIGKKFRPGRDSAGDVCGLG